MKLTEMISSSPIEVEKSVRGDEIRALTTCKAGKIVPVTYIPLLREDRVSRGNLRLSLDMAETVHPLMNSINVTAYVHLIPFLAFDRFKGMDDFNRSYQNIAEAHNSTVIPFITTTTFKRDDELWKTLGVHWKENAPINGMVMEAYNELVNFRRKARSDKLPLRGVADKTLAQAFWKNPGMSHIVPDFESAMMEGEVPLQFTVSKLPVRSTSSITSGLRKSPSGADNYSPTIDGAGGASWGDQIFVEMQNSGIKLSLANIELAKQTASFAKMRSQYAGLDDDHLIDLLMEGIRVPDEALRQPILLDKKSTIFGYSERHAMDGASLDMSVTTGSTTLDLSFRTPALNTGGIILVTVEIVPEQLWERCQDPFLAMTNPNQFPNFLRDYLDPEKVSVVKNEYVDVEHATPTGTFGYAPLNHEWRRSLTRIGGKYYRRNPDTFVEDRQRFWSVEKLNPTLTTDFYMVQNLPHTVFLDTISDPFEILTLGSCQIVGNTVFGKTLEENDGHYAEVLAEVDKTRIVQGV